MDARPDKIASFWLVYYPGTTIGQKACEEGILDESDLKAINSGDDKFLYTFMFPGGKAAKRLKKLRPYQTLFDIIPWLPRRITAWLISKNLVKYLPHSGMLHQALMVFNAFRIGEREDLQAIRYTFSRKNIPFNKRRTS